MTDTSRTDASDLVTDHGPISLTIAGAGYTTENIPVNILHSLFVDSILWLRDLSQNPKKGVAKWNVTLDCKDKKQRLAYELLSMTRIRGVIEGILANMPSLHSRYPQTQFYPTFQVLAGNMIHVTVQWNK